MTWLWVTIIAYVILGFTQVVNRYLLAGPLPDPKAYTFYVGTLAMFVFLLTPFFGLDILPGLEMIVALLSGFLFVAGLFFLYAGLRRFEVSRVVPAIGGLVPIFVLVLSFLVFKEGRFEGTDLLALALLVLGSIAITIEQGKGMTLPSLRLAGAAAFLLAFSFVLAKYVYLAGSFWSPFVWMRVGGFIFAVGLFIFSRELRKTVFAGGLGGVRERKKTTAIFVGNQVLGAGGSILQSFAIFLAPVLYVAFVNALEGVIYVFVLIFAAIASVLFPRLIPEVFTREAIFQKVFATALIVAGILVLSL